MSQAERDYFKAHLGDLTKLLLKCQDLSYKICWSYSWMSLAEQKRFQKLLKQHIDYMSGFVK